MNSGRASRNSVNRFGGKTICNELPPTAVPATIERRASFLFCSGSASIAPILTPRYTDIFEYISGGAPSSAGWALQNVTFVGDLARFTQRCFNSNIQLEAVSDGSFKEMHGTASWRLSIPLSEDYFLGSAISPGPCAAQSAYRSELTGLYGIAVTLWAIKQSYNCSMLVDIGCDGLSALSHFQYDTDICNPTVSHFDIISATRWLLGQIGGQYQWRHIKGHQDDKEDAILDHWAQFNIQMDTEAKLHWTRTHEIDASSRPMRIYGESGSLTIKQEKVVVEMKQQLMNYLGSFKAVEHWEDRFNWGRGRGVHVNWHALGIAVSGEVQSRRLWASKFASGFSDAEG